VYYVESEAAFYYCDGSALQPLDLEGLDGEAGVDGSSCTVVDNGDGTKTISCEDGSSAVVSDGVSSPYEFRDYTINHLAAGDLVLTLPDGTTDSLVVATVINGTTQVSTGGYLAVTNAASGDSKLFVNIGDGDGIACSVFHNEDDVPRRDWYFSTDAGNNVGTIWESTWGVGVLIPTFTLSRAGDSVVVLPPNVQLDVLCY